MLLRTFIPSVNAAFNLSSIAFNYSAMMLFLLKRTLLSLTPVMGLQLLLFRG